MIGSLLLLICSIVSCVNIQASPSVIDSTTTYAKQDVSSSSNKISIKRPPNGKDGDLLILFLSRTDARLPKSLNGWDIAASCLKWTNGQDQCFTMEKCEQQMGGGKYCEYFAGKKTGEDLGTVVFYRPFNGSQKSYTWDLPNNKAAWAILVTVRGVNRNAPVRAYTGVSNDGSIKSVFASTTGKAGDLLLLSMAFDDPAHDSRGKRLRGAFNASVVTAFEAPVTTEKVNWINGVDEAGFVYCKVLTNDGATGELTTKGPGGPAAKDALISLVLRGA